MNEQEKKEYLERYEEKKHKGVPFFPNILFKDAVVSLLVFVIIVALVFTVGAPLEARADPADTTYTPRPEWYFLFLFQMLRYFPGELEVIGVFIIPTLAILLLVALPFLDRSPRRHYLNRLAVTGFTALGALLIIFLTVQAVQDEPPPSEAAPQDETAALYTENCAPCHGPSINVPVGTNLHEVILSGRHDEGMPAWSADLTTNEIDALAGFILSPGGSQIYAQNCEACHDVNSLVAGDPLQLKAALEEGADFQPHADVEVPDWEAELTPQERTALLNFLVAPDGQRLFALNCASCHGQAVAFSGEPQELQSIITTGGLHLEMPPWRERLSEEQLDTLARYVVDPGSVPDGQDLFDAYCSECHGNRIPGAASVEQAREVIASGGGHETMPVWGEILTDDQVNALVSYTLEAARGTSIEVGQEIFGQFCSTCHGDFGEGGQNPSRPGDVIAPISSAEYLRTRDDFTLRSIIAQGQPNFGMSPFGTAYGGPLEPEEIDAVVAYIRSWEENPPVELPPEVAAVENVSLEAGDIFQEVCAQCHGERGEGLVGTALADPSYQETHSDQEIFDAINLGHEATAMIAWGEILTQDQIQGLVDYIRGLEPVEVQGPAETATPTRPSAGVSRTPTPTEQAAEASPSPTSAPGAEGAPTFVGDILPLFEEKCTMCHGNLGGWDASDYESAMTTGDNSPVIIPGQAEDSLLAQKLLGTHTEGGIMPPMGKLPGEEIQLVIDWINAGAPEQ